MTVKKASTPSTWTDPDDAPALTEEFFRKADLFDGETLVRRGRPKAAVTKTPIKSALMPMCWPPCVPAATAGKPASTTPCALLCCWLGVWASGFFWARYGRPRAGAVKRS